MSETASMNKIIATQPEPSNDSGERFTTALQGPSQDHGDSPGDEDVALVAENSVPPSMNIVTSRTSLSEESEESDQPASMKGKQPDDTIELLVSRFRDFLEAQPAPNPPASDHSNAKRDTTGRGRVFGLSKGLSSETSGSSNRFDYEQKYPRDRLGEELAPNARVWLTYLDEAEAFDRDKVEGWKDTVDVLLVFAGLFSGVITTFVSQASQNLQQDNTLVSASLLFEIAQLLRAQFSGMPVTNIPKSTLTPNSPFTPSTNAFLVNGLWFTSLAITLSTALFAVLAKQWLYYYLSSISVSTAHEHARVRQLRFKGFELWKVGAVVDLLPILLHLAVGIFLTGIIILLFPLDTRVAWTIVAVIGTTYILYFISVILPIRYPGCPYTTSLTIYVGILFFVLRGIFRWISANSKKAVHRMKWQEEDFSSEGSLGSKLISPEKVMRSIMGSIRTVLQYLYSLVPYAFFHALGDRMHRSFQALGGCISTTDFPKFTNWREENIRNAIKDAAPLDHEALDWLYKTTSNTSVHRIIARCVSVHPILTQKFESLLEDLQETLQVNKTNLVDLRYALCLDLRVHRRYHQQIWPLLRSNSFMKGSQLEEAEYQSYSRIAEDVGAKNYGKILIKASSDMTLKLPLAMWHYFLANARADATAITQVATFKECNPFDWRPNPMQSTHNTGLASFKAVLEDDGDPRQWIFDYHFRRFCPYTKPDYSSASKSFETRYLLLVSVYRNLTRRPVGDKEDRQLRLLPRLFKDFWHWFLPKHRPLSPKHYFAFFRDILSVDAFWSESMTDEARMEAVWCLYRMWDWMVTDVANLLPFMEPDDFSRIYQWCSRDLNESLLRYTTPIFTLLFMSQNRDGLCRILLNDPAAGVSNFSRCLQNFLECSGTLGVSRKYVYPGLMHLFKSVDPKESLFMILYNPSVLVQLWKFFVFFELDVKVLYHVVRSKLNQEELNDLYDAMIAQAQSHEVPDNDHTDSDSEELNYRTHMFHAFEASAHEFGRIIGAPHPQLESTTGNSGPEVATGDHDTEERGQMPSANEHEGSQSIAHRIKMMFGSVWPWPKISAK